MKFNLLLKNIKIFRTQDIYKEKYRNAIAKDILVYIKSKYDSYEDRKPRNSSVELIEISKFKKEFDRLVKLKVFTEDYSKNIYKFTVMTYKLLIEHHNKQVHDIMYGNAAKDFKTSL
jgi:hypothetical protein